MINKNVENMKADAKNAVYDMGNMTSHAKANAKADASKAKADVGNKMAHAKADAMKPKVKMGSKMADARRRRLPHGSRSDKK